MSTKRKRIRLSPAQVRWLEDPRPFTTTEDRTFIALLKKGVVERGDEYDYGTSRTDYRITPAGREALELSGARPPMTSPSDPALDEAVGRLTVKAEIWQRTNPLHKGEWVLEISGVINDTSFVCRHTEPPETAAEDVAGLPSLYAELAKAGERIAELENAAAERYGILNENRVAFEKLAKAIARAEAAEAQLATARAEGFAEGVEAAVKVIDGLGPLSEHWDTVAAIRALPNPHRLASHPVQDPEVVE